ncbi:RND family efflux transporter, MFP subunit [Anaerovirgula multivorans]|uniref:RND family efflux transporter, MFP subunit n=1 Tax=Anaerovirgula multivorans TaxID=312168 RepID=A0A239KYA4_9FIRM|nr:HlyD family efflux transporter periplasmic adaptor subunit [Anaerovirgula multivorans]SNT22479.1 RND family efflux transporter, MFP subunit [Anaerovirgula multivorans]
MKKIVVLILMMILLLTGCQSQKQQELEVPGKNVKVMQAETKKYPLTLEYIGIVDSQDLRTSAFKTVGKIEEIYVKSGQRVKKGDRLMRISEDDLKTKVDIGKAQYEMAKTQYDMAVNGPVQEDINKAKIEVEIAERNYIDAKDNYEKYEKLMEAGAISLQQLQNNKLELDLEEKKLNSVREAYNKVSRGTREEELEVSKKQMDIAFASYQQSQDLLENSGLRSEIEGVVSEILVKEGDHITQGMPVIAIKSDESTIKVGVNNEDVSKIVLGMGVMVKHQGNEIKGKVETIASIPSHQSSLYEVKINLEPNSIPIGTLLDVFFILGEEEGLFVPMNSLLNEGFDYVYLVQEDKVVMREVVLGEVFGNEIEVKKGINPGDKVVVEGMRSVKSNDRVEIKE